MESFWLNDKKNWVVLSQLSHFMIFWEASPDPIPSFWLSSSSCGFFCFCYKTSLVLSSLHAWQGHIFAFWMGIHCAFLIPDSCDPAEIPAESYGFPSQRWVSHGPPRKTTRILWATDFLSRASAAFAETPAVSSELWEKRQAAFLDKDLSMKQINDVSFKHSSYIITVHMYILYNYIYMSL